MANRFDDVERMVDQHARRLARELGNFLVDVGQMLRRQAESAEPAPPASPRREETRPRTSSSQEAATTAGRTRDDLLAEAAEWSIRGRTKMTKAELERAIRNARRGNGRM